MTVLRLMISGMGGHLRLIALTMGRTPRGTSVVTDFINATNTLYVAGFTAAVENGDTYSLSNSPPGIYGTGNNPRSHREFQFEATAAAIPEFPTGLAAIVVAGLCFGIYWWMRKRRLAHVKA